MFEEWWDSSEEAGPKTRPRADFSESKPTLQVLTLNESGNKLLPFSCKPLDEKHMFYFTIFGPLRLFVWILFAFSASLICARLPPNVLDTVSGHSEVLTKELADWNSKWMGENKVEIPTTRQVVGSTRVVTPDGGKPARRTLCRPHFSEGDAPIDTQKPVSSTTIMSITDFEEQKVFPGGNLFASRAAEHHHCFS